MTDLAQAFLLTIVATATAQAQQPTPDERLKRLGAIIGAWETVDTYQPYSPAPIVERGVRRCGYVMHNRCIECITIGTNASGRQREYRFYLTWDNQRGAYTWLSFWSNVGHLVLKVFTIDLEGRVWDIRDTAPEVEDHVETRTWSTLPFATADTATWVGRSNRSTQPPTEWPVSFRETWRRVPRSAPAQTVKK